ncbi:MAG TPA: hypothetical protein VJN92_18975 [Candidatus Acidoferrum sp.]|nr:hypothetical protein [Candidatus Acidoferrum sp.]
MDRFYCERETEIAKALRAGALDVELEKHVASCAICSDTAAVSESLQLESPATPILPDSDFLWWKAQLAAKEMAVERATRSIVMVRRAAYVGTGAVAMWLAMAPSRLGSIMDVLSRHQLWSASALSQTALFLGAGALVFTLFGSLYLARPEK